jgi:hypothetical protein
MGLDARWMLGPVFVASFFAGAVDVGSGEHNVALAQGCSCHGCLNDFCSTCLGDGADCAQPEPPFTGPPWCWPVNLPSPACSPC